MVLAKIRNKLPDFFLIPRHTGNLSQEMKIVPYLTGAELQNVVVHNKKVTFCPEWAKGLNIMFLSIGHDQTTNRQTCSSADKQCFLTPLKSAIPDGLV